MGIGWMGWYTPIFIILYLIFIRIIFLYEKRQPAFQEAKLYYGEQSIQRVYLYFAISAIFIIGAGIWLAMIGDEIALVTGLGKSFVGSLFLAFTTTLPEITVSFAAMRMGAKDMAIANMLGSNLYNLTIISIDALLYAKEPILTSVSEGNLITAFAVIAMTLILIAGLHFKSRKFFRLSWCNSALIILFLLSACFSFSLA